MSEELAGEATEPDPALLGPVPDELRDLPEVRVGVEPLPYETSLPFERVPPEEFERVCLVIVEQVDGTREARLYGVRGQKDFGIDLVAWDDDGGVVLYQVKRYKSFTEKDFEAAVDAYAKARPDEEPHRAFRPKRFVLCVACSIDESDRTQITDTLDSLREEHDFEVDLYDGRQLTKRLRTRSDLIRQFFGEGWVEALARGNTEPIPSEPTEADILIQAAQRGPFTALGLDDQLAAASRDDLSDAERAALLGEIADALDEAGFREFGEDMRVEQSRALHKAGDGLRAAKISGEIAWEYVSCGRIEHSHDAERALAEVDLAALGGGWPDYRVTLNQIAEWYRGTEDSVTAVVERAAGLVAVGHPLAPDVLVWVAETAVAVRDHEALGTLAPLIGEQVANRSLADPLSVRLACCVADMCGDWPPLVDQARAGDLEPRYASLVFARAARGAALRSDPNHAWLYLREAVRDATRAECFEDAGDLILATMRVDLSYELKKDSFRLHKVAHGFRDAGTGSLVVRTKSAEYGRNALGDGNLRRALVYLRQSLREAVIAGRLEHEREAEAFLGEALIMGQENSLGIRHLIRGGRHEQVKRRLESVEGWVDETDPLIDGPPWEKGSALVAVTVCADFIDDDRVVQIVDLAIAGTDGVVQAPFAPLVDLEAWKALAALAPRFNQDQASTVLDKLDLFVERGDGTAYRFDDGHVDIVASVYLAHPELRDRCAHHMVRLIAQGHSLADRALTSASPLFDERDPVLIGGLVDLADEADHPGALKALLWMDIGHPKLDEYAAGRVAAELECREPEHMFSIGTDLPTTGVLARLLDEDTKSALAARLMARIEDARELEINRTEAAYALLNLADALPGHLRDELFERAMVIAAGPDIGPADVTLEESAEHPLSSIRVNMRWGSLQPAAARAAGRLASSEEQQRSVAELVTPLLHQRPDPFSNDLAHTLHSLRAVAQDLDLGLLSRADSLWARQLAAATWVHRPDDSPGLGDRLAGDRNAGVRRTLAGGLGVLAVHDGPTAERLHARLSNDPAYSVRAEVEDLAPGDG